MKRSILLILALFVAGLCQAQYHNVKGVRVIHDSDSTGISGVGMIRWDKNTGKFRFWDGDSWFTYSAGVTAPAWGDITGTLSNQTDLQTALSGKVGVTGTETVTGTKTFNAAIFSLAGSNEVLYRRSSDGLVDGNSQFTYGGGGNPVIVPALRISSLVAGQVPYTIVNDEISGESGFEYNSTTNTLTVDNITTNSFSSGTYTPTFTGVSNVTSVTGYTCQYMQVGIVVTVSGRADVTETGTGVTSFRITLPIASNWTNTDNNQCAGTGHSVGSEKSAQVIADTGNDEAFFKYTVSTAGTHEFWFTFTYLVL